MLEFEGTLEDGYKYAKEYVLKNYNEVFHFYVGNLVGAPLLLIYLE